MTECNPKPIDLTSVKSRQVQVDFTGGNVTSDAGVLLLREVDRMMGLTHKVAPLLEDSRQSGKVRHEALTMLQQRVYALAAGWEDLNDFDTLRHDVLYQSATNTLQPLASASTLCRFENQQTREVAWAVNAQLVETFIASFDEAPQELVLDFDATDDPTHGKQEGRFFHGYYDHYCFLPLYVFCGDKLLVAYLRPSNIDASKHAAAITKLLVQRLRRAWPQVQITIRADGGFCRERLLGWSDRHEVNYIVGIARNARLEALGSALQQQAREAFEQSGEAQRLFGDFAYSAKSWNWLRLIIHKAEHLSKGANPRFVVTNLVGNPQELYEQVYCARGEMENRIKEQLMLFHDRTSAHQWWANQWRVLLSAMAYTLMETLRSRYLQGTELARAQCNTLRLKLIKIGAVITRNTRRIRLHISTAYPLQKLLSELFAKLVPG